MSKATGMNLLCPYNCLYIPSSSYIRTSPVAEVRMMNEGASPDRVRLIVKVSSGSLMRSLVILMFTHCCESHGAKTTVLLTAS